MVQKSGAFQAMCNKGPLIPKKFVFGLQIRFRNECLKIGLQTQHLESKMSDQNGPGKLFNLRFDLCRA